MPGSDDIRPYSDDEINAVIQRLLRQRDFLDLVGCYTNALDSISILKETKIDLIFIDIEMQQQALLVGTMMT